MPDPEVAIACRLDPERVPGRLDEWRNLAALATERRTTPDGVEVLFPTPGMAVALADLVRAEHECCPFFGFTIRFDGRGLSLEVTAPPEARPLVDQLLAPNQS